jgi:hypothetical protein
MKRYHIIDEQGYVHGDYRANKHSEARYKLINSSLWPIAKNIKEISSNGFTTKIYTVSEVYSQWQ